MENPSIEVITESHPKRGTVFTVVHSKVRALNYDKKGLHVMYLFHPISGEAHFLRPHLWGEKYGLVEELKVMKKERDFHVEHAVALLDDSSRWYSIVPAGVHLMDISKEANATIISILKMNEKTIARLHKKKNR